MIRSKENQSTKFPYGAMVTKLLETLNIDTMDEAIDSSNHMITYSFLKMMKVHIKHEKLRDDPVFEEETWKKHKLYQ